LILIQLPCTIGSPRRNYETPTRKCERKKIKKKKKKKKELPYDPTIPLLGRSPEELKAEY